MLNKPAIILIVISFSFPVLGMAQQAAHVHGFAEFNIAIDGDDMQIEFSSPADSILGFEYEPSTSTERKAMTEAIAILRDPSNLFVLPSNAACRLQEVEAERHADDEKHSEFHAHYHFVCNGSWPETISLKLFETWPRIEEVRVQALTPGGQVGGSFDANDPLIRLQ